MTIAAKLLQINGVKEDIRDAIESFGYDLSNVPFTQYAEWIALLGSETSITPTASGGNGNISDDLDELANVKADIKTAIESKGISLTNVPFTDYAQYIYQIPVASTDPLRFTATQNGTISWNRGSGSSQQPWPNLEFSKNGDSWSTFNSTINVNAGDYVEFRNNGTAWVASASNNRFSLTGAFNLSGNIMSLVDSSVQSTTIPIANCFQYLFSGCTAIVSAADLELPATTLTNWCYYSMFYTCTGMTSAPALPATTLTDYCYRDMFFGCSSLTQAPALPATTLAQYCYYDMFRSCTSLTTAPELPATTLVTACYQNMFMSCTNLTTAPSILPATSLVINCYDSMFRACAALRTAPVLPATTLAYQCYNYMFFGCTNLNYIKALFTTTPSNNYTQAWVSSVASSGTFVKSPDAKWTTTGVNAVPTGWTVDYDDSPSLRFTANTAGSTIQLTQEGSPTAITLEKSTDGSTWTNYTIGDTITLANQNDFVMFRGNNSNVSTGSSSYYKFVMTGSIAASGRITSLYDKTMQSTTIPSVHCFDRMFLNCTSLTTAPELPATTLEYGCYGYMFYGCTGLTQAPELPATTLAQVCYESMFGQCSNLNYIKCLATDISALACTRWWLSGVSATGTFVKNSSMSSWETGISGIPDGWTVINDGTYTVTATSNDPNKGTVTGGGTFDAGEVVTLTATAANGYTFTNWTVNGSVVSTSNPYVFRAGETITVTGNFAKPSQPLTFTALQNNSSVGWSGTYPNLEYSKNGGTWTAFTEPVSADTGDTVMFRNNGTAWGGSSYGSQFTTSGTFDLNGNIMSLVDSTMQSTTIPMTYCFHNLFSGTNIVSAEYLELPATTLADFCYINMFSACTSLTTPPVLPATTLAEGCYCGMFSSCAALATTPVLPATTLADSCYMMMFYGCTSITQAPELPANTLITYCYYYMFADCANLNYIKCLATNISASRCTEDWVYHVPSGGTFVKDASMTDWTTGNSGIPSGWTVIDAQ